MGKGTLVFTYVSQAYSKLQRWSMNRSRVREREREKELLLVKNTPLHSSNRTKSIKIHEAEEQLSLTSMNLSNIFQELPSMHTRKKNTTKKNENFFWFFFKSSNYWSKELSCRVCLVNPLFNICCAIFMCTRFTLYPTVSDDAFQVVKSVFLIMSTFLVQLLSGRVWISEKTVTKLSCFSSWDGEEKANINRLTNDL